MAPLFMPSALLSVSKTCARGWQGRIRARSACLRSQRALLDVSRAFTQRHARRQQVDGTRANESHSQSIRRPIAVLGGGLSGLTTALYLSRLLPEQKIILFEASDHLGGWVRSEKIPLSNGQGQVVIESGPRSIRPRGISGWRMIEMIHSLNLMSRIILVPSSALSAKNRFIYFAGQFNKLPSSLGGLLGAAARLPLLRSLLPVAPSGIFCQALQPSRLSRPISESADEIDRQREREDCLDESVESFVKRHFGDRFGSRFLDNLLSAVLHGIYAADTKQLSARSTLPFLWETEQRHGSLMRALLPLKWNRHYREPSRADKEVEAEDLAALVKAKAIVGEDWTTKLEKASVFSLKGGLGDITQAMVAELKRGRNLSLRTSDTIEAILRSRDGAGLCLQTCSGEDVLVQRLVSTIPSRELANILGSHSKRAEGQARLQIGRSLLAVLRHNPSTDVGVVSFAIPHSTLPEAQRNSRLIKIDEAFGFLIPRAETPNNPDGILGVVFDSDAIPGQDEVNEGEGVTKLTVMLGGPYLSSRPLPSDDECRERAVRALDHFLSIPCSISTHPDTVVRSRMQPACIPTYLPGHYSRMRRLHEELRNSVDGLIAVTGASYTGVSVNDVVHQARRIAERIAREGRRRGAGCVTTGLEMFVAE